MSWTIMLKILYYLSFLNLFSSTREMSWLGNLEKLHPFCRRRLSVVEQIYLHLHHVFIFYQIKEASCKKGIMEFALEFYDFPDDSK